MVVLDPLYPGAMRSFNLVVKNALIGTCSGWNGVPTTRMRMWLG